MENQISISKEELKRELESSVGLWVERTFNYIKVQVLEKYCDSTLHEYIYHQSPSEVFEDWLSDYDEMEKIAEFFSEKGYDDFGDFQTLYEQADVTIKESFISVLGEEFFEEFKEWCLIKYEDDIYEYVSEKENYPVWNTCFEFRDSFYNSEEEIVKCLSVGLGVIEGLDDFNNLVFMTSFGHSFYSAYWIPLYLSFYPSEAEKYAGINYSDL